ncbi:MAG TPA: CDP-alcohol phosphatidyltransferase family protein [Nocardioides sp.]|uniref:CDP-alcohol phosphatidyltransferase family protein n=1 Tax=Nocardioides sp. TaxID=35761 RepID=UPI002E316F9E|nr:CDP-alcohol phosphatidyltransferase family protein [Nocardioides sp.]HEX5087789.1 CDP-alcohol phosphatidyltransferase family protein [Nocardioides sp.]
MSRANAANVITGARFVLSAAVAAVALAGGSPLLLGTVLTVTMLTDLVDGWVARARGTTSELGARLDMEADALLILVLSAIVAADLGWWVLGLGLARYVFGALFAVVPALRTPPTSPRPWCKTVAVLVGVVLAVVAVLPVPHVVALAAVVVVAVLLAESFLHEAVDRWLAPRPPLVVPYGTVLAFLVVWLALVAPVDRDHLTAHALLRLPIEVLVVVAIALVPWPRVRVALAVAVGLVLALLLLLKVLDISFNTIFDRDFDPVGDYYYLGPGVGVLGDSIGTWPARIVAVLAAVATLAILVGVSLAMVRLVRVTARHLRLSLKVATAFATAWVLAFGTGAPVTSSNALSVSIDEVNLVRADIHDTRVFSREIGQDAYAARAARDPQSLVAGLAGKDVLLVFVESYGRVAVQDTSYSAGVDKVLDQGTAALDAAGYHSQSAFLTSPTFGAGSWLAHSSLQSGLWVDSQRRYEQLLGADRMTLTSLFGQAGWRTVFDVPADTKDWPEGADYYGFQHYYDSRNVGFQGPKFGYAPIPDQYTLSDFRRRELAPTDRKPVMAEIDLISSHHPWTPLPTMVPWDQVGDGSIYDSQSQSPTSEEVFKDPDKVKEMYGRSVEYSWQALTSFLTTYNDPNLVLVVLGDHQPHGYVSGEHVGHDVPVSVIAQDPAVMQRIAGWGWQDGLRPSPDADVWRMDTFRDKFLQAFSN